MQNNGEWYPCDDAEIRPIIRAEVLAADGSWIQTMFLLDTGADRTVFDVSLASILALCHQDSPTKLRSAGGLVESTEVLAQIRLTRDTGTTVDFTGRFAVVTDPEALEMSVLGRDITNLFAAIIDFPGKTVCLLRERHNYVIQQS